MPLTGSPRSGAPSVGRGSLREQPCGLKQLLPASSLPSLLPQVSNPHLSQKPPPPLHPSWHLRLEGPEPTHLSKSMKNPASVSLSIKQRYDRICCISQGYCGESTTRCTYNSLHHRIVQIVCTIVPIRACGPYIPFPEAPWYAGPRKARRLLRFHQELFFDRCDCILLASKVRLLNASPPPWL